MRAFQLATLRSVVRPPEAVLAEEGEEQAEAGEERGQAQVLEVVADGVLHALEARLDGAAGLDASLPGEESGLADTSAVVLGLEEVEPLVDGVVVLLFAEALSEGEEFNAAVGGSSFSDALLVGLDGAAEVVAKGGSAAGRDSSLSPGLLLDCIDGLAGAIDGAHVSLEARVSIEVETDIDIAGSGRAGGIVFSV